MTKAESQTVLKPCPHCGSTGLNGPHLTEYIGDTYHPSWWVECNQCPAYMQVDGEGPEPLVEAWNRRSGETSRTFTQAQPDPALLQSMAIRHRHDFELLDSGRQAAILGQMRQLWEEVVGLGFYRPHNY
jgi:hypothetical protein